MNQLKKILCLKIFLLAVALLFSCKSTNRQTSISTSVEHSEGFLRHIDEPVNCCVDQKGIYGSFETEYSDDVTYIFLDNATEWSGSESSSICDSTKLDIGAWDDLEACPPPAGKVNWNTYGRPLVDNCTMITGFFVMPGVCSCTGKSMHTDVEDLECSKFYEKKKEVVGDQTGKTWEDFDKLGHGDNSREDDAKAPLELLIKQIEDTCSGGGSLALTETQKSKFCGEYYLSTLKTLSDSVKQLREQGLNQSADLFEKIASDTGNAVLNAIVTGASFLPYLGGGIDIFEAVSGKSISPPHQTLSTTERTISVIASFASVVPFGGKGIKVLASMITDIKKTKAGTKFGDNVLQQADDIVDSANKLGIKGKDLSGTTKEIQKLVKNNPCTAFYIPKQDIYDKILGLFVGTAYAAGLCNKDIVDIYEAAAKNKPLGKGSTGRAKPANLSEQAALLVTRADPQNGRKLDLDLNDSRWPSSEGWEKWEAVYRNDGQNIVIHYVRNPSKGLVDDFKFKN